MWWLTGLACWATKLWGHMGPGVSRTLGTVSYSIILNSFICELVSCKWEKEWAQKLKWYPGVCPPIFAILAADGISLSCEHRIPAHPQYMQVQQDTKRVLVHLWLSAVSPERPPSLQTKTCFEYTRKGYKKHKWPRSPIMSCLTRVTSLYEATAYAENDDREGKGKMG